ncbi:YmaF family protein [Clostridium sp. MSJ-11]|uniref:YmaF family protein n=1 Tax=Clostridium mobile TaxID=2841512 RepID=A0ABS6EGZ7_9CLOT|nr:YmaF family protein [Clostridium mobile]MBU5483684.1 YmaF family protein [Clostridium mobile]
MSERDLNYNSKNCSPEPNGSQSHTHEFLGSTRLAVEGANRHNHRFAGVTSEVIPMGNSHVHAILVNTDFFLNHIHEIGVTTGPAIDVGNGKHVHLATGVTTVNVGHNHSFIFATLIEDPLR